MGILPTCLCITCVLGACGDQKQASGQLGLKLDCWELPCGCQESNPGPPEEQLVLLTTKISLQPL